MHSTYIEVESYEAVDGNVYDVYYGTCAEPGCYWDTDPSETQRAALALAWGHRIATADADEVASLCPPLAEGEEFCIACGAEQPMEQMVKRGVEWFCADCDHQMRRG